ncbi:MAG: class F sortase [Chloroflexi bacterium]|nr:MAG: class F sortase [Chloroflexota bacterium]
MSGISDAPVVGRIVRIYQNSSRQRKALLALGGVLFLVGVALLIAGLVTLMSDDSTATPALLKLSPTPTAQRPPTVTPKPAPPLAGQAYRMVIDKLGVNAPVEAFGLDAQAIPQVPTGANAKDIVAWYNFSAEPGTGSNAVFAGHVTWFGEAVFFNLTKLAAGDTIRLEGANGKQLVYNVSNVFSVDPDDPNSLQVMAGTPKDMLTIITCDGSFQRTGDPVFGGEYNSRLVVQAQKAGSAAGGG